MGLTLSLYDIRVQPGGEKIAKELWDEDFEFYLPYIREDDFWACRTTPGRSSAPRGQITPDTDRPVTQMGYENYPFAIGNLVRRVAKEFPGELDHHGKRHFHCR